MTTQLLMHMDSGLTDETGLHSPYGQTGAAVSTAQSKFGAGSLYFPTGAAACRLGAFDFTGDNANHSIEMWVLLSSNANVCFAGAYGYSATFGTDASGRLGHNLAGSFTSAGSAVPTGQWVHVALCRANGFAKTFINGAVQSQATVTATSSFSDFTLGNVFGNNGLVNGYMDEVRIVTGTALYYRAFTPPTAPFAVAHPLPPFEVADYTVAPKGRNNVLAMGTVRQKAKHLPLWISTVLTKPKLLDRSSDYGSYRIVGTTKVAGTPNLPVKQRVMLLEERAGRPIAQVWSDPVTGAYAFNNITNAQTYTVVSFDHQGLFDAVIADNLQATPMP